MSFYRHLKNVINNRDYFYNKRKEINEYELSQLEDNNINDNKKYLYNNIIAENNIRKYKENINNRENIIERNYKNLNIYQNNRYNHNIYDLKKNNKIIPLRNNQDNIYNYSDNRMYKSESTKDVLKNNFYLSQLNNKKDKLNNSNYYINYTNRTLGKKKTDITDNNLIQIYSNKQNFVDYYNKNVEIQNENKKMTEEKNNNKKNKKYESRIKEQKEIKMENNYYNSIATQNLLGEKKSKMIYKKLLDEQIKNNINDKLMNENLSYEDIILNKNYLLKNNNMTDRKFLNKNRYVEVNPYNQRNYDLGNSSLENDVIVNPQIIFKQNKYIFPQKFL